MNNWTSPRPSMIDLGKKSKVALLAGCGGGGDIMNTIPVMNLLKKLGVEKFVLADIGCKWWEFNGEMALGGEVIDLDWAPAVRKAQRKRGDYQQGNKGCGRPWKRRISARIFDEKCP